MTFRKGNEKKRDLDGEPPRKKIKYISGSRQMTEKEFEEYKKRNPDWNKPLTQEEKERRKERREWAEKYLNDESIYSLNMTSYNT